MWMDSISISPPDGTPTRRESTRAESLSPIRAASSCLTRGNAASTAPTPPHRSTNSRRERFAYAETISAKMAAHSHLARSLGQTSKSSRHSMNDAQFIESFLRYRRKKRLLGFGVGSQFRFEQRAESRPCPHNLHLVRPEKGRTAFPPRTLNVRTGCSDSSSKRFRVRLLLRP